MTQEWINEKIKEAHENAVEKGFYDCPECKGACNIPIIKDGIIIDYERCDCNDTETPGIDPNKNIGELLMLIVSELGEALEAHREDYRCKQEWIDAFTDVFKTSSKGDRFGFFEGYIKDTFEDELADVFIRLFDLCGYLNIKPETNETTTIDSHFNNVGEAFLRIVQFISNIEDYQINTWAYMLIKVLNDFSSLNNIDIEKHIEAKMAYNKTRPHKHGKAY